MDFRGDRSGRLWFEHVIEEVISEFLVSALTQNRHVVGVECKAFPGEHKGKVRVAADCHLCYLSPYLRYQHVARNDLVPHFFVEIGTEKRLLPDGQIARPLEL